MVKVTPYTSTLSKLNGTLEQVNRLVGVLKYVNRIFVNNEGSIDMSVCGPIDGRCEACR